MPVILLGLGYLLLAAAGAACWGLALAGSRRGAEASAYRTTSLLVAGGLAALARAGAGVVGLLALPDPGFAQEKAVVGLPISAVTSILAAIVWWMPRRGAPVSARRDGDHGRCVRGGRRRRSRGDRPHHRRRGARWAVPPRWSCSRPCAGVVRGRDGAGPHPALGRIEATRVAAGVAASVAVIAGVCVVAVRDHDRARARCRPRGSARRARTTTAPAAPPHWAPTAARSPT